MNVWTVCNGLLGILEDLAKSDIAIVIVGACIFCSLFRLFIKLFKYEVH